MQKVTAPRKNGERINVLRLSSFCSVCMDQMVIAVLAEIALQISTGESEHGNAAVNRCTPDRFHIVEMRLGEIDRVELWLGAEKLDVVITSAAEMHGSAAHMRK